MDELLEAGTLNRTSLIGLSRFLMGFFSSEPKQDSRMETRCTREIEVTRNNLLAAIDALPE